VSEGSKPTEPKSRRRILTRRRFLLGCAALGVYTWQIEPHWARLVERKLPIPNLPESWVGKKLVHLSDIHVGPVSSRYLSSWFREINSWKPDLILITGDFMSSIADEQIAATIRQMELLEPAKSGTFAAFGNHDYGKTWKNQAVAGELLKQLTPLGIRVLRNQQVNLSGLQIIGLDDLWSGNFDLELGLSRFDPTQAAICMSHNPDTVDLLGWGNYQSWILSGHTHGGQCKPAFLKPPIVPVINKRYTSGEFELSGNRRLYISTGIGYVKSVRFNVRPEVALFELTRDRVG
jgi:uncharacterized protein